MSEALETEDLAPEAGAGDTQPDETELEAIAMGWKPKSEFKGPDDKFVEAAEYVERGKTIMPFLRKELQGAYRKIESLERAVSESVKHISRAEQRAYDQAKRDLEAELEKYAAAGDAKSVKAVTQDIVALERETIAKGDAAKADEPPEFTAWKSENEWFGKDRAMTAAAAAIGEEVIAEGYTGKAQIKEVDARLREKFPGFFNPQNPNRKLPGAVEGAGAPRKTGGKSYSDLPPDAKAMCDDMVKTIKGFTREKYVKTFFEDNK